MQSNWSGGFLLLHMKIVSNWANSFVGSLASILLSLSCVSSLVIKFHEHTQKDKGSYSSVYAPQSLAGKAERKAMVNSLLRSGLWEEGENSWGKDPPGCLVIQVGEEQTVLILAPWLGCVLMTHLNRLGLNFMGSNIFPPLGKP